ncbi:MAG: universal stress protein [Nitrospirae bacterium]|nr:universal stress protein [Nitrospirota bacterium]
MNSQICPFDRSGRLLLATDGSKFSEGAIREALSLSRRCSSMLIAIYVVKTNLELEITMSRVIEKEEEEAAKHLEAIMMRASQEGIDCEISAPHSEEPYRDIVDAAAKSRADVIIMGRHGRTGLPRLMMGSVAARVIGHAPCNVLVIPPDAKVECRNILMATDGSGFSEAAAREAIGIAKKCESALIVVSVAWNDAEVSAVENNVRKIVDLAKADGVQAEGRTLIGKPYEAIVATTKQRHADLIIVGSHGRTGLKRLLMGSVTERVIGHSETAVLVVKA